MSADSLILLPSQHRDSPYLIWRLDLVTHLSTEYGRRNSAWLPLHTGVTCYTATDNKLVSQVVS